MSFHFLLVNPCIHDLAAYDFWLKPLGLLTLAESLRKSGISVSLLPCAHPELTAEKLSYLKKNVRTKQYIVQFSARQGRPGGASVIHSSAQFKIRMCYCRNQGERVCDIFGGHAALFH